MELNNAEVIAEVTALFMQYEQALVTNDIAVLDKLFWNHPKTIRYGATENLVGYEQIKAFRNQRSSIGLARTLDDTVISTFGSDMATANTTFTRENDNRVGRQSQTWIRFPEGWRIVAAHVSWMG
ncbi:oxalurate catabolism protein HpxZ [Tolumonas lignilytica]|uniref:oxalurate catabolism protein HpxZ n=1 Tax=Tolumonas lignilytica TaxID=1283284 RepID=UPI0004B57A88|nr:oxalurate catabolism protein HpxZ [Tolumonas lignilytica]